MYNEDNIEILTPEQARERHNYVQADKVKQQYSHIHPEFIDKLLAAAWQVGEPWADVQQRYLEKDYIVQVSEEFRAAYLSLT